MPDERESLGDLRDHIDAAHAAADRLVREAQERAERADRAFRERVSGLPETGWDVGPEHRPPSGPPAELQAVLRLLEALREAIPPELTAQLAVAVRELLLAIRALIDWYLERPDAAGAATRAAGDRVEDIPIA